MERAPAGEDKGQEVVANAEPSGLNTPTLGGQFSFPRPHSLLPTSHFSLPWKEALTSDLALDSPPFLIQSHSKPVFSASKL
ncbi:hypothetical protein MJO28_003872 [Puccinia striiformis f. sp. tritici]|uniref:Uncharacterized protein n=1 Tax=Puccinia striiformis f. sp. tritici TaxID=168172 RepID=A0ACC0EMF1_9BASI|nr:hypothetical protein MJO28_003872 [Puccinia striiformis f. sp. tritici]